MMMPMKDDDDNWLGFSLSPHMKMESNNFTNEEAPPPSSSTFENGDYHSPLSEMPPLKSADTSLCLMEAFSTSHSQGSGSSPKLENFLGGATTMATHDHDAHMFLSLDSAFYNNYQEPFRQQQQQQYYYYYSGLVNYTDQIPPMSDHGFPCLKTWIDDDHHDNQESEQQFNNNNNSTTMVENNKGSAILVDQLQQSSLSLSMSPGSQSSCCTVTKKTSYNNKKRSGAGAGAPPQKQTVHRKSIDTFGQRTSQYRGVTRHRWTGRYEAHLWDNSCKKEGQTRKGRQVYLGGYDMEEKAARAYDLAALKYWGSSTHINFPLENYHQELEEMKNMSRQEYVAHLRRRSSGFSRGASMYRGVTRHHQHGRWQARIGRVAGNKDLYLGTFSTQEEAAEAYDIAAIKFRGANAVTNFDMSRYDAEKIMASNTLPAGEIARRKNDETGPITAQCCLLESLDVKKAMNTGDYHQNLSFDETINHVASHFSNPSSLVTSLSSSREASPDDRNGARFLFVKPSSSSSSSALETKFINPSSNVNTWIQTTNLPVFASWNDLALV